jgi:hypothetical protein
MKDNKGFTSWRQFSAALSATNKDAIPTDLDVSKIPGVMLQQKPPWTNGALLMKRWLKAAPKSTSFPIDGTQCTNIVRMNWVLSYPRARRVYYEMLSRRIWLERKAKEKLVKVLKKKNLIGKPSIVFFGKKMLPFAHKDFITKYHVGDTIDQNFKNSFLVKNQSNITR